LISPASEQGELLGCVGLTVLKGFTGTWLEGTGSVYFDDRTAAASRRRMWCIHASRLVALAGSQL
jgi:hypothetical protein